MVERLIDFIKDQEDQPDAADVSSLSLTYTLARNLCSMPVDE